MKELIRRDERIATKITLDDELALIPKCGETLDDWKVLTTEMLRKTLPDMMDKLKAEEATQVEANLRTATNRLNETMRKMKTKVNSTQFTWWN
jgi:hypothetical protein